MSDAGSAAGPTVIRSAMSTRRATTSSWMGRATSRGLPAGQTWPRGKKSAGGGAAGARGGGAGGGEVGVGVVEQDVGRLAAQPQQDLLDRAGGQGGDPPADLGGAGEGDLVDPGRGDQRLPPPPGPPRARRAHPPRPA